MKTLLLALSIAALIGLSAVSTVSVASDTARQSTADKTS